MMYVVYVTDVYIYIMLLLYLKYFVYEFKSC